MFWESLPQFVLYIHLRTSFHMPAGRCTGAVPCVVRTELYPFCFPPLRWYERPYHINFHSEILWILTKATRQKMCKHCSWWTGCNPNPYPHFLFYYLIELRATWWCNWLRHYAAGRGFHSRWCHWNFSLTQSFPPQYDSEVDSASNRNEY